MVDPFFTGIANPLISDGQEIMEMAGVILAIRALLLSLETDPITSKSAGFWKSERFIPAKGMPDESDVMLQPDAISK